MEINSLYNILANTLVNNYIIPKYYAHLSEGGDINGIISNIKWIPVHSATGKLIKLELQYIFYISIDNTSHRVLNIDFEGGIKKYLQEYKNGTYI